MSVAATTFFEHLDSFFDYRTSIYETSSQTLKSSCQGKSEALGIPLAG